MAILGSPVAQCGEVCVPFHKGHPRGVLLKRRQQWHRRWSFLVSSHHLEGGLGNREEQNFIWSPEPRPQEALTGEARAQRCSRLLSHRPRPLHTAEAETEKRLPAAWSSDSLEWWRPLQACLHRAQGWCLHAHLWRQLWHPWPPAKGCALTHSWESEGQAWLCSQEWRGFVPHSLISRKELSLSGGLRSQ